MKRLIRLIFLLIIILSSFTIKGQEDHSRQLKMMDQVSSLVRQSQHEGALELLKSNYDLFHQDQVTKFWYDWLNGVILYQYGHYKEAYSFITDAVSFLNYIEDELHNSDLKPFLPVYYYVSDIDYRLNNDKNSAIEKLEHAKYIYEKAGAINENIYSMINNDLSSLKFNIVDLSSKALNNYLSGKYEDSIPQLLQIIDYEKNYTQSDITNLANWQRLLAISYMNIGDYANSEQYFLESLKFLETNNLQKDSLYRKILDSLSILYFNLHNYEQANILNEKAKFLYEDALDFGDDYITCLNNCAIIKNGLGYNNIAKMLIDMALRHADANFNYKTSLSQYMDNAEQIMNKEDQESIDNNFYIQSKIMPYIATLSNAASIYYDLGYFSDAIRVAKKSIQTAEEYGLNYTAAYNNLGSFYLNNSKFKQSIKWYQKGYDLSITPYENNQIGFNLAISLFLSKDFEASKFSSEFSSKMRTSIQDMFTFMSGAERAAYWNHLENFLPWLNLIIYETGQSEYYSSIYDNIIESKGLLLRSTVAIREAIMKSGDTKDKNDYERLVNLKQLLLTEANDSLRKSYTKEIEDIDKRLTININSYSNLAHSRNITHKEVKNNLDSDDIAIEFYNIPLLSGIDSIQTLESKPRYCAVTLRKGYDTPHIIPLFTEEKLEDLENEDMYETDILYNLIWKPLENELKGVKNIYFAADRELHKIGIEYAPMPDGQNIGDKYNIYRLSSTRVLAENKGNGQKSNAVLYGGLKYDMDKDSLVAESRSGNYHPTSVSRAITDETMRYGFRYLPGTLKEVEEISKNFSNIPKVITDIKGTEESFKALAGSSVDIIHLATHGFFWNDEEAKKRDYVSFLKNNKNQESAEDNALLRSGLCFSGANIGLKGEEELPHDVEDGVLTALELSNMNLGNVDMVVMSACESGLGETSGEGVFGLQRGFKLAGANTLLMSLWKVEDEATQILMTEFYRNYLSGKSKQESLKLAQQYLRNYTDGEKNYSNPKYWAAFILLDGLN